MYRVTHQPHLITRNIKKKLQPGLAGSILEIINSPLDQIIQFNGFSDEPYELRLPE